MKGIKWIEVKERLPQFGRVLTYSPEYEPDITMTYRILDAHFVGMSKEVTHWAFLVSPYMKTLTIE